MRKQILTALSLGALLTTSLTADSCQINSGAYAGVGVGMTHLGGTNDLTTVNPDPAADFPKNQHKLSATSLAASIFGGYGAKFGCLWTAGELFYQFDSLSSKDAFNHSGAERSDRKITLKSSGAFGGAVHLGYALNNSIVYAIVGVEGRRFKLTYSQVNPAAISKGYTSTAFVPGLGLRLGLGKNFSARVEYKCAIHPRKSISTTAPVPGAGTETITVKSTPQVHSVQVGCIYNF